MAGERHDEDEHGVGIIDLSHLDDAGLASVVARVEMARVHYQLDGTSLVVGSTDLEAIRELVTETIALLIAQEGGLDDGDPLDRIDTLAPALVIASGWRRLAGYLAETVVLSLVVLVYQVLTHTTPIEGAAGLVVPVLNGVVAVAVVGRTVGMAITGTRVIMASTTEPPGWLTAIVRWVVAVGPGLIPFVIHLAGVDLAPDTWSTLSIVTLAWTIVVYLPIVYDHRRRGLHDRAAGTEVVLSRRPR